MWSRGACCLVAMFAVSCVQGMILYDESEEPQDEVYQMENDVEDEIIPSPDLMDANSQLLYRLMAAQDYAKLFNIPYRSRRIHSDMGQENTNLYFHKRSDDSVQLNDKRDRKTPVALKVPKRPPQQKWKLKKGAHMVCYFKLCTFRPYV